MKEEDWNINDFLAKVNAGDFDAEDLEEIEITDVAEEVETVDEVEEEIQQPEPVEEPVEEVKVDETFKKQQEIIETLNKKLDTVLEYNNQKEEQIQKANLEKLENERLDAMKYGDVKSVLEIEEKIKQNQLTKKTEPVKVEVNQPDFVKKFEQENPWFGKDHEMSEFMTDQAELLVRKRGIKLEDAIVRAKEMVKRQFPEKFENPKRKEAAQVITKTQNLAARQKKTLTLADLDETQRQVYEGLKNHMSLKEYLEGLNDV